jgi:HEAT repeat protein
MLLGSATTASAAVTEADIPADLPPQLTRLIEQTFSSDYRQRVNAAREIGQMHERAVDVAPFLIRLLEDVIGDVRASATDCFATLRDPRAVDPLIRTLKIAWSSSQQHSAIIALGHQQDPRAVPALMQAETALRFSAALRWLHPVVRGSCSGK